MFFNLFVSSSFLGKLSLKFNSADWELFPPHYQLQEEFEVDQA